MTDETTAAETIERAEDELRAFDEIEAPLSPHTWREILALAKSAKPPVDELIAAASAVQVKLDHEFEGVTFIEADRLRAALAAMKEQGK